MSPEKKSIRDSNKLLYKIKKDLESKGYELTTSEADEKYKFAYLSIEEYPFGSGDDFTKEEVYQVEKKLNQLGYEFMVYDGGDDYYEVTLSIENGKAKLTPDQHKKFLKQQFPDVIKKEKKPDLKPTKVGQKVKMIEYGGLGVPDEHKKTIFVVKSIDPKWKQFKGASISGGATIVSGDTKFTMPLQMLEVTNGSVTPAPAKKSTGSKKQPDLPFDNDFRKGFKKGDTIDYKRGGQTFRNNEVINVGVGTYTIDNFGLKTIKWSEVILPKPESLSLNAQNLYYKVILKGNKTYVTDFNSPKNSNMAMNDLAIKELLKNGYVKQKGNSKNGYVTYIDAIKKPAPAKKVTRSKKPAPAKKVTRSKTVTQKNATGKIKVKGYDVKGYNRDYPDPKSYPRNTANKKSKPATKKVAKKVAKGINRKKPVIQRQRVVKQKPEQTNLIDKLFN